MAVNKTQAGLNFSGGIQEVSYIEDSKRQPELPQTTRIIYFNQDAAPSNLSKLFRSFNGQNLVNKVCRPSRKEYELLNTGGSVRQAMSALQWLIDLETLIEPKMRQQAEATLAQIAELELKVQVQRSLLVKV